MCMYVMNSMDGRILEPQNNVFISIFFFYFFSSTSELAEG